MTEEPNNIVLQQLRLIRDEIAVMKDEVTHKIGAMAETLVGVKRDISILRTTITSVEVSVHGARQDIATLSIAVDEHTHRLERIEKKLDLTHA
jgi:predicted  nucleic acid-binding Zn-ribbon protein